ncbi:MAG: C_GCAxxG_C_C family protein [Ruminiclostridium sp.]|nr:C_GCAxxG_C_C family protein [Ruminiclostridium sp.]
MNDRVEKAISYHKNFSTCSASVLCAFADLAGITEEQARFISKPFAGGKMGKCGALLAAEYVIDQIFGDKAEAVKEKLETEFRKKNTTLMCRELKGGLTGKVLRSCRGCVTDAAELLSDIITNV